MGSTTRWPTTPRGSASTTTSPSASPMRLAHGVERVAYVDVDVHHGDGVEAAFWDDPRVLTISLHESGRTLFPGTGHPDDIGGPGAEGSVVNVALPAGTDDRRWLEAFQRVVPERLAAFRPQLLVTQQGCDTHRDDPLAHLELTVDGQRRDVRPPARAGARARRRPVGGDGWWRLCGGRRRAARLGASRRDRRRPAGGSVDAGSPGVAVVRAPAPGPRKSVSHGRWWFLMFSPVSALVVTTIGATTTPRRGASHPRRDGRSNGRRRRARAR